MNTIYNVDYFIRKYSGIELGVLWHNGCALSQCGIADYENLNPEASALIKLFHTYLSRNTEDERLFIGWVVIKINDGTDIRYKQETATLRILAALQDIKKLQEPKEKPSILPELLTTPVAETSDLKQESVLKGFFDELARNYGQLKK